MARLVGVEHLHQTRMPHPDPAGKRSVEVPQQDSDPTSHPSSCFVIVTAISAQPSEL
jgi:hypothetical protein